VNDLLCSALNAVRLSHAASVTVPSAVPEGAATRVPEAMIYASEVSFAVLRDTAELDFLNRKPAGFLLPAEVVDLMRAAAVTDLPLCVGPSSSRQDGRLLYGGRERRRPRALPRAAGWPGPAVRAQLQACRGQHGDRRPTEPARVR